MTVLLLYIYIFGVKEETKKDYMKVDGRKQGGGTDHKIVKIMCSLEGG